MLRVVTDYYLRARCLDDTARAMWALVIIAVPIMGVVAFATLQPGVRRSSRWVLTSSTYGSCSTDKRRPAS